MVSEIKILKADDLREHLAFHRKFAEIYEVFSMLIIAKDSALTYQTSTQEYVVFNVSGWIISMGRRNSLA